VIGIAALAGWLAMQPRRDHGGRVSALNLAVFLALIAAAGRRGRLMRRQPAPPSPLPATRRGGLYIFGSPQ